MSVRIQSDMIGSADATRQAEQLRGGNGTSRPKFDTLGGSGFDSVNVSSETRSITETLSAVSSARDQRVQALAAAYAGGRYRVDAKALSGAMIDSALRTSGTE